ncbi:hypothetical protein P7K49_012176, partial [Saguinus oedipus]
ASGGKAADADVLRCPTPGNWQPSEKDSLVSSGSGLSYLFLPVKGTSCRQELTWLSRNLGGHTKSPSESGRSLHVDGAGGLRSRDNGRAEGLGPCETVQGREVAGSARPRPRPRPRGPGPARQGVARGSDVTARWRRLLQAAEGGFRPQRSESIRGGERASGADRGRSSGGGAWTVPSDPY